MGSASIHHFLGVRKSEPHSACHAEKGLLGSSGLGVPRSQMPHLLAARGKRLGLAAATSRRTRGRWLLFLDLQSNQKRTCNPSTAIVLGSWTCKVLQRVAHRERERERYIYICITVIFGGKQLLWVLWRFMLALLTVRFRPIRVVPYT